MTLTDIIGYFTVDGKHIKKSYAVSILANELDVSPKRADGVVSLLLNPEPLEERSRIKKSVHFVECKRLEEFIIEAKKIRNS